MTVNTIITAPNWESKYAQRVKCWTDSPIRELFKRLGDRSIVSFAGGLPAPETFPAEAFQNTFASILHGLQYADFPTEKYQHVMNELLKGIKTDRHIIDESLQYHKTAGYEPLRKLLAEKVNKYGVPAKMENVFLTCGSQQGLFLTGLIFVENGTVILSDRPTYLGAIQAWSSLEGKFCTVPINNEGTMVEELRGFIEKYHPKFLYFTPNFHNPGGVCTILRCREIIVELAEEYDLFIVEDDPYGDIRFEGEHIPPIISLAKERTIYLCTFSKTLAPSARVGWVIAPEEVIAKFDQAKQGADLFTSTILQMAVYRILETGMLPEHIKTIRALYKERRDAMISSLEKYAPEGSSWTHPNGGLFLWHTVPKGIHVPTFANSIIGSDKLAVVPGNAFYPPEVPEWYEHVKDLPEAKTLHVIREKRTEENDSMRLNFSKEKPEVIEDGIKRLCEAEKKELMKK
jgi:2-aminoadipate transaminase